MGALCRTCAAVIRSSRALVPEQISSEPCSCPRAVLLDPFGGVHGVTSGTVIGRRRDFAAIVIAQEGVSRHHARLSCDDSGVWFIEDLGSTNGSFANGERVARAPIAWGDTIQIADVSLYFEDALSVNSLGIVPSTQTVPNEPVGEADITAIGPMPDAYVLGRQRWVLSEPSGGGGGVAQVAGTTLALTYPQFELIRMLLDRAGVDAALSSEVRGFVSTGELVARIPWDTAHPDEDNVKHLVRRVRKILAAATANVSIESRPGFGYRLRQADD